MRSMLAVFLVIGVAAGGCTSWPDQRTPAAQRMAAAAEPRIHVAQEPRGRGNRGLPPGIAKNLERGKPLPPGIAKRHVPPEQLRRLPAAREGFEYVVVAGKVVLIETATRVVHDVLADVMFD